MDQAGKNILRNTNWIKTLGRKVRVEGEGNPHCPQEQAHLYHTLDWASTEIETINLLAALIRSVKPKLVLETGTYNAYMTAAFGIALKENGFGKLISLELDTKKVIKAKRKIKSMKLSDYVQILEQASLDFIKQADGEQFKFEFAFFDSVNEIRPDEFFGLYEKGMLLDFVAFHDTSRFHGLAVPERKEIQDEYVRRMDEIEEKYCRGGLEFPISRGVRIMQLRRDINPAYRKD